MSRLSPERTKQLRAICEAAASDPAGPWRDDIPAAFDDIDDLTAQLAAKDAEILQLKENLLTLSAFAGKLETDFAALKSQPSGAGEPKETE